MAVKYSSDEVRSSLYRERKSLEEFDVQKEGTLDQCHLDKIQSSIVSEYEGAEDLALDMFNNAYYITTAVMVERHPRLHFRDFLMIAQSAGGGNHTLKPQLEAITMAMVCNYLQAADSKYSFGNDKLIKQIAEHYQTGTGIYTSDFPQPLFHHILMGVSEKAFNIDRSRFAPLGQEPQSPPQEGEQPAALQDKEQERDKAWVRKLTPYFLIPKFASDYYEAIKEQKSHPTRITEITADYLDKGLIKDKLDGKLTEFWELLHCGKTTDGEEEERRKAECLYPREYNCFQNQVKKKRMK